MPDRIPIHVPEFCLLFLIAISGLLVATAAPKTPLTVPYASSADVGAVASFPLCARGRRVNCVIDGDTLWLRGEKIRIANIDAPEVDGRCPHEIRLAALATQRLSQLLAGSRIRVERQGVDRHGRTLARVATGSGDAGQQLVREGLARSWRGHTEAWCG